MPNGRSELFSSDRPSARKGRRLILAGSGLALTVLLAGVPALAVAQSITLPGEFAFRTAKGYYLTAVNGGGRSEAPVIHTAATRAGAMEKFRIVVGDPAPQYDKSFQTATGNYITAVNGGGMTADALHTNATQIRAWERFRMNDLSNTYYAINTIGGRSVTAVGAGGHYEDAIHTDGFRVDTWEMFKPVKCGDLGSGLDYYIILPSAAHGQVLFAPDGGGRLNTAVKMSYGGQPGTTFKLMRQTDGTYALQTSNGVNFVTALGGGGKVQVVENCDFSFSNACLAGFSDIFHTDATRVLGWEKFRITDQGDCKYTIQTASGFYFGLYQENYLLFTTRRTEITDNEKFEFVMSGLGSPPIVR